MSGAENIHCMPPLGASAKTPSVITAADMDLLRELDGDLAAAETSSGTARGCLAPASKRVKKQSRRVWWPDQQDDVGPEGGGGFVVKTSKQV